MPRSHVILASLLLAPRAASFQTPLLRSKIHHHAQRSPDCRCSENGDENGKQRDLGDRVNELLDKPIFDPSAPKGANTPKLLSDFQDLFETNPELAETLWVGGYFALLLVFAQQGVRIYKHCYFMPDSMCPWDVTSMSDSLIGL